MRDPVRSSGATLHGPRGCRAFSLLGTRNDQQPQSPCARRAHGARPLLRSARSPAPTAEYGIPAWLRYESSPNSTTTNHLLSPFTYDQTGNLTFDGANTVVYDGENRVYTSAQTTSGSTTTMQYTYDAEGRRIEKQQVGGGSNTIYVHDSAGTLVAEYSNTPVPSGDVGTQYLTYDHLGSTRLITNATGVARCYDYLPFGEELVAGVDGRNASCYETGTETLGQDVESTKFTGKERDAETGLDYFGARYFSGAQGRFTVDVVIGRWQQLSAKRATLDGDGRTFDEIAQQRNQEPA
jgi:RHS repeat-associated protein